MRVSSSKSALNAPQYNTQNHLLSSLRAYAGEWDMRKLTSECLFFQLMTWSVGDVHQKHRMPHSVTIRLIRPSSPNSRDVGATLIAVTHLAQSIHTVTPLRLGPSARRSSNWVSILHNHPHPPLPHHKSMNCTFRGDQTRSRLLKPHPVNSIRIAKNGFNFHLNSKSMQWCMNANAIANILRHVIHSFGWLIVWLARINIHSLNGFFLRFSFCGLMNVKQMSLKF